MMKKMVGLLLIGLSAHANAAANFLISNAAIVAPETTVHTTCLNTQGFYFEMGERDIDANTRVIGFNKKFPLEITLKQLSPPSWLIIFDSHVNKQQPIAWSGNESWLGWLQQLSREKNLAIIVDWDNHRLFVNRL